MLKLITKLINRYKAKKEHDKRMNSRAWIMNFNTSLEYIKERNKKQLLHELMEVTNTKDWDIPNICELDALIEQRKKEGLVTELYTKNMEQQ